MTRQVINHYTAAGCYARARECLDEARNLLAMAWADGPRHRRGRGAAHQLLAVRKFNEAVKWRAHARAFRKEGVPK